MYNQIAGPSHRLDTRKTSDAGLDIDADAIRNLQVSFFVSLKSKKRIEQSGTKTRRCTVYRGKSGHLIGQYSREYSKIGQSETRVNFNGRSTQGNEKERYVFLLEKKFRKFPKNSKKIPENPESSENILKLKMIQIQMHTCQSELISSSIWSSWPRQTRRG